MSTYLPFVMQQLFNRPALVSDDHSKMISAALAGRLNISQFEDSFTRLDAAEMERIAAGGRATADAQRIAFEAKWANRGVDMSAQQANNSSQKGKIFPSAGPIAVIPVWGTLTRNWGVGPYSGSTGYDGIMIQYLAALEDKEIKAIWFDINSGGGTVDGCFDLCDLIWSTNQKNGGPKPVYCMAADYAYSAAYAIATCGDKLFVNRTGGVGSVGVIYMHADITGALEQQGVKVRVFRAGDRKFRGNQYEEMDEEEAAHIQQQLDDVREIFIETVARNMGIAKKTVSETEALDYMGARAKTIGFVNDVLSEQQAWAKLERKIARNEG